MQSSSEINTISKRAARAVGYSWGVAEEVGKCISSIEMFGISGVENLNNYIDKIIADEKNSTYRAKQRYFEIFPLKGLKYFLPREIFILNKNLDAIAALIILEDYFGCKFKINKKISTKTWLK